MLKKKWNVYLIHHSHTDIGYTERQEKIARYHYGFIRQAINALDFSHSTQEEKYSGFVWQCENFWQVKQFYQYASQEEKEKFETYVKKGEIGLSGNYLNMTDLTLGDAFEEVMEELDDYSEKIGVPVTAGMCADVNGLAWGYPDVLYHHGIRYFYTALHPHHGMFPLYKKVRPYYWKTPEGNTLLMWNGDHYHLGNEMFFCPHGGSDYTFHDEFSAGLQTNSILNKDASHVGEEELEICVTRISRYLENLEAEEYPYDLVPFMVSGAITDNAPPNVEIARRVHDLNVYFAGRVTFKMVTLEEFFHEVESRCEDIPTYSGDFTDWWADGVSSTVAPTKIYLEAARKFSLCRKLDPAYQIVSKERMRRAAEDLMMYAEHTWGYSSSVSEPWDSMVESLEYKKSAYAVNANTEISRSLDDMLTHMGEVSICQDKPQHYIIKNPHPHQMHTTAFLYIEFWEYVDGLRFDEGMPIVVKNSETGAILPSQVKRIARATQVEVEVDLAPEELIHVEIHLVKNPYHEYETVRNYAHIGAEGVEDILQKVRADETQIDSDFFTVRLNGQNGVESIIWNETGTELVRKDRLAAPFSGVYEVTDMKNDPCLVRKKMGRNRKSYASKRYYAMLSDRRITETGDLYNAIELDYSLEGTKFYTVMMKVYKHLPKIEINVRIHKTSNWEPENLYISLPFSAGDTSSFYVDKTGCFFRPGIDQLPGSCEDFYLIQNAAVWTSGDKYVSVITKDAPLITMGNLEPRRIVLCDGNDTERNQDYVYSWAMNNFWETNFKVDLGGFYEFRYILQAGHETSIQEIFSQAKAENEGIVTGYAE